jgi:hypothetical protein
MARPPAAVRYQVTEERLDGVADSAEHGQGRKRPRGQNLERQAATGGIDVHAYPRGLWERHGWVTSCHGSVTVGEYRAGRADGSVLRVTGERGTVGGVAVGATRSPGAGGGGPRRGSVSNRPDTPESARERSGYCSDRREGRPRRSRGPRRPPACAVDPDPRPPEPRTAVIRSWTAWALPIPAPRRFWCSRTRGSPAGPARARSRSA